MILEIFRVNGDLIYYGDQLTEPFGLTSSRWQVMGALELAPRTVSGIAKIMGLQRQSVQRTVNILTEQGYLEMTDNPGHKTAKLFRMTSEGMRIYKKIVALHSAWEERVIAAFREDELKTAFRTLVTLRNILEES